MMSKISISKAKGRKREKNVCERDYTPIDIEKELKKCDHGLFLTQYNHILHGFGAHR